MILLAHWMEWLCELFACTAENDLRVNQLIVHIPSDAD